MKKVLLFTFSLCIYQANAQYSYNFVTLSQTYQNLAGSTVVSNPEWDFSETAFVPFGFSFPFFDQTFSGNIMVSGDGMMLLGTVGGDLYFVQPSGAYLESTGFAESPISYLLSGTNGNYILKIEYKNAKIDGAESQYINFQAWFYQNGIIEFHYGPSITNESDLSPIGIFKNSSVNTENLFLVGDLGNPTLSKNTTGPLSGTIGNGTVYRFSKSTSVPMIIKEEELLVFPNPSTGKINFLNQFNSDEIAVNISNVTGTYCSIVHLKNNSMDLSHLAKGMYMLEITDGEYILHKKIVLD